MLAWDSPLFALEFLHSGASVSSSLITEFGVGVVILQTATR